MLVRAAGLWAGTRLGAKWANAEPAAGQYMWMGLISQAGVAIGLASVMASVYPERGEELKTLFLATLTVNQTLGPIMFRIALLRSGEATPESFQGGGPGAGAGQARRMVRRRTGLVERAEGGGGGRQLVRRTAPPMARRRPAPAPPHDAESSSPTTPATSEPARMPTLAASSFAPSPNASAAMNSAIVKPMPPSAPMPSTWRQLVP